MIIPYFYSSLGKDLANITYTTRDLHVNCAFYSNNNVESMGLLIDRASVLIIYAQLSLPTNQLMVFTSLFSAVGSHNIIPSLPSGHFSEVHTKYNFVWADCMVIGLKSEATHQIANRESLIIIM